MGSTKTPKEKKKMEISIVVDKNFKDPTSPKYFLASEWLEFSKENAELLIKKIAEVRTAAKKELGYAFWYPNLCFKKGEEVFLFDVKNVRFIDTLGNFRPSKLGFQMAVNSLTDFFQEYETKAAHGVDECMQMDLEDHMVLLGEYVQGMEEDMKSPRGKKIEINS